METYPYSDQVVDEAHEIARWLLDQIGQKFASVRTPVVVVALAMLLASFYRQGLASAGSQGPEATEDVRRLFRLLWRIVLSEDESPLGHA